MVYVPMPAERSSRCLDASTGRAVPPISHLLGFRGPLTVAGFVSPVVVGSINRVSHARTLAHVREEVVERQPALADGDAASAVVPPVGVAWPGAAANHRVPTPVLGRAAVGAPRSQPFQVLAAATDGLACAQVRASGDHAAAAVTGAAPVGLRTSPATARALTNVLDGNEPSEPLSSDVLVLRASHESDATAWRLTTA